MSNEITWWIAKQGRSYTIVNNRALNHGDVIGIFVDDGHPIVSRLDEVIGHSEWSLQQITEVEFETYKEFGFRVLELGEF